MNSHDISIIESHLVDLDAFELVESCARDTSGFHINLLCLRVVLSCGSVVELPICERDGSLKPADLLKKALAILEIGL